MRYQIRNDSNFTNSVAGHWFQPGLTFECTVAPMKTGTLRVFPPDGRGQPIDVPVGLMEPID
jgi:hypothetical protein